MNPKIPSLGTTASEILTNALNYECAGFILKFTVVGEGVYYFSADCKFKKLLWIGDIPTSEDCSQTFDEWLLKQISKGFVTIHLDSPGKRPFYSKEIHRATGTPIPYGSW